MRQGHIYSISLDLSKGFFKLDKVWCMLKGGGCGRGGGIIFKFGESCSCRLALGQTDGRTDRQSHRGKSISVQKRLESKKRHESERVGNLKKV